MNMNISTGGFHILFFERDSSLMALLISEFQLAGYECHTARTAVEVFDAIARYPIRVVLVNMAQAAAGRREFWVALDTQRRGRGVQVFTYHCYNLAGYGPRETDERSQGVVVDMEIDGMLGLMNLVDRIRERVPTTSAATGTIPRFSRTAPPSSPSYSASPPISSESQSYSEKIRAVLSSNPRPASIPVSEAVNGLGDVPQATSGTDAITLQRLANGQPQWEPRESGLAQLSRMVQEYHPSLPEEMSTALPHQVTGSIGSQPLRASPIEDLPLDRGVNDSTVGESTRRGEKGTRASYATNGQSGPGYGSYQEATAPMPLASIRATIPADPVAAAASATQPLPSPSSRQPSSSPQASVTTLTAPARPTVPIPAITTTSPLQAVKQASSTRVQEPQNVRQEAVAVAGPAGPEVRETLEEQRNDLMEQDQLKEVQEEVAVLEELETVRVAESGEARPSMEVRERVQTEEREERQRSDNREGREAATSQEVVLVDILQSLPASQTPSAMSPASAVSSHPSSPPQVLNGRSLRPLGNVLLEGHLVPQSRLEVAQNIQRMLRGVDLRYELGEILLMFKLLTPDQLLAATLVSHGLISTQQISALGRIRQELHSIGLEYDLESLLILFRMLTPEQLREVRASWQG